MPLQYAIIYEGARDKRMPLIDVIWDLPDDPDGNVQHIAEHGLTPSDVEYALNHPSVAKPVVQAAGRSVLAERLAAREL